MRRSQCHRQRTTHLITRHGETWLFSLRIRYKKNALSQVKDNAVTIPLLSFYLPHVMLHLACNELLHVQREWMAHPRRPLRMVSPLFIRIGVDER